MVVVITGASAGVGRATAQAFACHGARLGLVSRNRERLEATAREVEELGGAALVCVADVADADRIEAVAREVEAAFGPIDIWINNAMASVFSPVIEMKPDEYRRVTDVTYHGYVWGTLAALKRMRPRDRGVIVQVGSALAYRGIPLQSAYCAAKHAVQGFNDSLRCELIHDGSNVQLTMVQLPAVNTPQFAWVRSRLPNRAQPVPPIYQPEVAADAIVFAALNPRRELKVGMPTLKAIFGNRIAPGFLDWYLARVAVDSQQIAGEPEDPTRPDNLYETVPGPYDSHGAFDERSRTRSRQLWFTKNRWACAASACLVGAAILAAARRDNRRWVRSS
jgi:NAD(P)-dependent dehydrogenase (short-subunit alcohol dehydrogenase family)